MLESKRIFKEPNKIYFPDDYTSHPKKSTIYELLMQTEGDYKKVSKILDQKISETNQLIKELTGNIKDMTDESFESKLFQLKNDNMETMLLCDEFRKIVSRKEKEQENFDLKCYKDDQMLQEKYKNGRLYEKPPQAPNRSIREINNHYNCHSNECYNHPMDSSPLGNHYTKRQKLWSENEDLDNEYQINRREKNYKREAAMERLTRSKSSLEKYQDFEKYHTGFDPEALVAKWRHKVTVPQPFEMTLREESNKKHRLIIDSKNGMRKSKTMLEFQAEKAQKEQQELEETKKQFKANPVPAHVYIPLYETMQEEMNQRRQFNREYNKEILKSMEKPFNFYKRDLEKQKQKYETANLTNDPSNGGRNSSNKLPLKSYYAERQKTIIRSKEAPKSSNDAVTVEKLKEDELFRQIKAEMRSKQLLEESKMPGNMAERQRIQNEKRKRRQLKENHWSLHKRSRSADFSRTQKSIPDFSKIHREWNEEIRMSYKEPFVTQPKPFNLLTSQRPLYRSTNDIENITTNNFNSSTNDLPTKSEWNRSILAALEMAKPSTNKSTMLREIAVKTKMMEEDTKVYNKAIEQLARKKREMDVSEKIRKSLEVDMLPKGEDKRRQKTKELKIENELRKENYQRELEEMQKKVSQKPLLLEAPITKPRPSPSHKKNIGGPNKAGSRKFTDYGSYDERNHFGDPGSYRSSADASCSMIGSHLSEKCDHTNQYIEENVFSH